MSGTDPAMVAARIMGLWERDPFAREVDLDRPWGCPLMVGTSLCGAAKKRGIRKEWVMIPCPAKDAKRGPAPPECPLRFGPVMVRAKA